MKSHSKYVCLLLFYCFISWIHAHLIQLDLISYRLNTGCTVGVVWKLIVDLYILLYLLSLSDIFTLFLARLYLWFISSSFSYHFLISSYLKNWNNTRFHKRLIFQNNLVKYFFCSLISFENIHFHCEHSIIASKSKENFFIWV